MDINLAKSVIQTAFKKAADEKDALAVAQDILLDTFEAEFQNLEVAQNEANDFAAKWNAEKTARALDVATLEGEIAAVESDLEGEKKVRAQEVAALTSEKDALLAKISALETTIQEKDAEILALKEQLDKCQNPPEDPPADPTV